MYPRDLGAVQADPAHQASLAEGHGVDVLPQRGGVQGGGHALVDEDKRGAAPERPAVSALWRGGFFGWVIVSRGFTPGDDRTEAEVISAAMMAAGVPADIILTEAAATNTGENVAFSLPILEARIGVKSSGSVISLGKHSTSVRYLMRLQRYWPDVRKRSCR